MRRALARAIMSVPAAAHTISVCMSCGGAPATLCDLEELAMYCTGGVAVCETSCLGACGAGPNVVVESAPAEGEWQGAMELVTDVYGLEAALAVVEGAAAAAGGECSVPVEVLRRQRLRSEAAAKIGTGRPDDLVRRANAFLRIHMGDVAHPHFFPRGCAKNHLWCTWRWALDN